MTPFNVFRRPLTVRRQVAFVGLAYDVAGEALEPDEVTLSIRGSVQPATGEQLQSLPENRRDVESYMIYTDTALETQDIIEINAVDFEVQGRDSWQNNIINHNAYLVQKVMA
jgi:hypothetical protein